jgi:DNA-binding response OmpR family regulator
VRFALVTDDAALTASLIECFAAVSIAVEPFADELLLMRAMRTSAYDLVMVDAKHSAMLVSSLLSWRNSHADLHTPIVVLTPFSSWDAMLRWINAGATDVASRYDLEQIRLRTHVALQRTREAAGSDTITLGRYVLRRDLGTVTRDGVEIPLTPREFAMAWLLFSNPGRFLNRAQIAGGVWGVCEDVAARSIQQHVYKLRKKLCLTEDSGLALKTVYALGYKLDVSAGAQQDDTADIDDEPVAAEVSAPNVVQFVRPSRPPQTAGQPSLTLAAGANHA